MTPYTQLQTTLPAQPHTWLVTGVAGFKDEYRSTLLKRGVTVDRHQRPGAHRARNPATRNHGLLPSEEEIRERLQGWEENAID